jgi:hypothetical protein
MKYSNMIIAIFLLGSLEVPANAARTWREIGQGSNASDYFADWDSIKQRSYGKFIYTEILVRKDHPEQIYRKKHSFEKYNRTYTLFNIRCLQNSYRIESIHGTDNSDKKIFVKHNLNFKKYNDVVSGSVVENIKQLACAKS